LRLTPSRFFLSVASLRLFFVSSPETDDGSRLKIF
jgi:hypothetical protein